MQIAWDQHGQCSVAELSGSLDTGSGRTLQRALLIALAERQNTLVCDLNGLKVGDRDALAVFGRVADQAARWPGTTLVLCVADAETAQHLRRTGSPHNLRFRMHRGTALTVDCAAVAPPRRRVLQLSPVPTSAAEARGFVRRICADQPPAVLETAVLAANEIVTHALAGTGANMCLYLTQAATAIRLAVSYDPGRRYPPAAVNGTGEDIPTPVNLRLLGPLLQAHGALPTTGGVLRWCLIT